jgi:hypothetical protein
LHHGLKDLHRHIFYVHSSNARLALPEEAPIRS